MCCSSRCAVIANNKKVSWSVAPENPNTELHFDVYNAERGHIKTIDGSRGQTIGFYVNNKSGVDIHVYIKLGGYIRDNNGNYTISFTETAAE